MKLCTRYCGIEQNSNHFLIHTNCADIKLFFLTDRIIRIRVSFRREFPEESYVLMTTAWEDRLDPLFTDERKRVIPVTPNITETETEIIFATNAVSLTFCKDPIHFELRNRDGILLYSDLPGNPYTQDLGSRITHYVRMEPDDCFYGFGEKTGELNKNRTFLRQRATDSLAYDPQRSDTLYKHIPFYIRLNRKTKKAVGVFYHNLYESCFNMGCETSNYWPRYSYYQADGGDIDYFLLGAGTIPDIINDYTLLTGRPILLPKRALGYQGSSMYYAELEKDCDKAIQSFVDTVKAEGFPIDGFHLSSGYTSINGKRCVFTWNKERFPDPGTYLASMRAQGAQNVPNVKPGILTCHPGYEDWKQAEVFVKDSESDNCAIGKWWGGDGAFWDYTKPEARALWKQLLTDNLIFKGTDSIWNDNCEYDSLMDRDARCDFDGTGGTIGQLKPIMSTLMCMLSNAAVEENDPNARPYTVCRSGSPGIQRYAQTWAGDNYTSWDSLKYNIPTILGMGLSGQPNEGADIGGFAGPAPTEELFVRWVQQGIFQPRFSIHSASSDNTVTEPWMYSKTKHLIQSAMLLRYRFTPYLYSCEYEANQTGAPIMRPLVYEFQNDTKVYQESFTYLFGRDLLVANVLEPNAVSRAVYLPEGCKWYDWNNKYTEYEGGSEISCPVTLETIPMFLREGGCVAMADNQLMNMAQDHTTALRLIIAPGKASSTVIYDDDGISNDFRNGVFRKTTVTVTPGTQTIIDFKSNSSYQDWVEQVTLEIIAKEKCPFHVTLDGAVLPHILNRNAFTQADIGWYYSQAKRTVEITYPNPKKDCSLIINFEPFDLIGM